MGSRRRNSNAIEDKRRPNHSGDHLSTAAWLDDACSIIDPLTGAPGFRCVAFTLNSTRSRNDKFGHDERQAGTPA
jgi:hypothetical protein